LKTLITKNECCPDGSKYFDDVFGDERNPHVFHGFFKNLLLQITGSLIQRITIRTNSRKKAQIVQGLPEFSLGKQIILGLLRIAETQKVEFLKRHIVHEAKTQKAERLVRPKNDQTFGT
jgi:hypothetical protein